VSDGTMISGDVHGFKRFFVTFHPTSHEAGR
jgi:hypothetical protein